MGVSIRGRTIRENLALERDIQNKRFDAILKNMPLGVCMFDADARLVLANEQYYSMYEMPDSLRGSHTKFADIVLHQKRIGAFFGEPDAFFKDIADPAPDGSQKKYLLRLHDGQIITVLKQPLLSGGWVSIHEDTTEQQLAKEDLEQTKRFLDLIIEGVPTPDDRQGRSFRSVYFD